MLGCPRSSWTYFGCLPATSSTVAHVCRRSCSLMAGSPDLLSSGLKCRSRTFYARACKLRPSLFGVPKISHLGDTVPSWWSVSFLATMSREQRSHLSTSARQRKEIAENDGTKAR